jgi:hypothetical protein
MRDCGMVPRIDEVRRMTDPFSFEPFTIDDAKPSAEPRRIPVDNGFNVGIQKCKAGSKLIRMSIEPDRGDCLAVYMTIQEAKRVRSALSALIDALS